MKTIEISGNQFELEDNLYKFIQNYLDRLDAYVKKHGIDTESYQDILQRISDKFLEVKLKGEISQKDCINIINQMGEPEDIFTDYDNKQTEFTEEENRELFFQRFYRAGWYRDTHNTWLLGVCKLLGEKLGIPVWLIRILFVLFLPIIGVGFSFYLILGVLIPIKGVDYSKSTILSYLGFQIFSLKDVLINGVANTTKLLQFVFVKIFKMSGTVAENIISVLRFVFFFLFGLFFVGIVMGSLIVGGALFVGISYQNIDFTGFFPNYSFVGVVLAAVSSTLFAIACIGRSFKKKLLNSYIIIAGIFLTVISAFLFISTAYHTFKSFSYTSSITQSVEFSLSSGENNINMNLGSLFGDRFYSNFNSKNIKFYLSTGTNIKLVINNNIYTKDKATAENIFSKLSQPVYSKSENIYVLSNSGNYIFSQSVPFSLFSRNIDLYIPEGVSVQLVGKRYFVENAYISNTQQKYKNYLYSCNGSKIYYSSGEAKFVCENEKDIAYLKRIYIQDQISKDIDTIIPIKHSKRFIQENHRYYDENDDRNSWNLHSFNWVDSGNVVVKVYDDNINIFTLLNVQETATGVNVLNKIVQKIEQKRRDLEYLDYENINLFTNLIVK